MSGPYEIARRHLEAAVAEAARENVDAARIGKALMSELLRLLQQHRSAADIRAETAFELENLEDDQEFTFMRP